LPKSVSPRHLRRHQHFNLTSDELIEVFANMKKLGRRYLEAALEHRNIGFSNLHQLITDIHEGHKKPCPAARA
jgi:uncharacterized protein